MKTAALTDVGEMEVQEREQPTPEDGEVLVQVSACGVCMTDFHMYHGSFAVDTPLVLGHESAGTIVDSRAEGFESGDRVAINPTIPCNACSYCKRGETHLCENNTVIGGAGETILDGAFAEYVRVPKTNVEDIGDMPFKRGALAEPLACCVHGVRQTDIEQGDSVAMIGAGPIGLLLLQTFRNRGASPIVVSEIDDDRRELASELGADHVVDPTDEDPVEFVKETIGPADIGVEVVGKVPTIEQAYDMTAKGGNTLIFGVPDQDATMELNPFDIYFNEIDLRGTYALTTEDFERAVSLLKQGRIDSDTLITEEISLGDLPTAFDRMANAKGLKKIVRPGKDV
ncbi:zinc-dependent alcohol dehydrogenase family protein [Halalkalicoccus sp. NIPERK01]|uniref:zinc-dependent alcohol dehydrogenase family protein n=1 Tax=Halalkalicoccus sp. NIPERK01 TaxID=3053469 RepID=UPI00256F5FA9|nr:zinc-dependent alcohol dehydrogenase family protein [Halalkalicoccus sp. NIPERK01]MDL5363369.1 zinc-dependent alcohol dehydrogenase family protein [Halalkalicoccus sp. NIPERK01]